MVAPPPAGCDFVAYCNKYPDLANAFCGGGPCTPAHAVACENHWKVHGQGEGRQCPAGTMVAPPPAGCDFVAYCNKYPDLANAFCGGGPCTPAHAAQCENHWNVHGKGEGRQCPAGAATPPAPLAGPCDFVAYCNKYPDLANAFCGGGPCTPAHAAQCENHWNVHGKGEGR